jgi:hypothetical protein
MTNDRLVELARLCAEHARITTSKDVIGPYSEIVGAQQDTGI